MGYSPWGLEESDMTGDEAQHGSSLARSYLNRVMWIEMSSRNLLMGWQIACVGRWGKGQRNRGNHLIQG